MWENQLCGYEEVGYQMKKLYTSIVYFSNLFGCSKENQQKLNSPNFNWIIFDPDCSLTTKYYVLLIQHAKWGLWMCLELLSFSRLELNSRDD